MKTIKMFLLAVAITVSSVVSATTESIEKDPTSLHEKITKLLEYPSLNFEHDINANVTFMFNKNSEIVVLAVDCDCKQTSNYIKNRLNYKKLDVSVEDLNKTFVVPVKIETE